MEVKLYVTLRFADPADGDDYDKTVGYVEEGITDLAINLGGAVVDMEVK